MKAMNRVSMMPVNSHEGCCKKPTFMAKITQLTMYGRKGNTCSDTPYGSISRYPGIKQDKNSLAHFLHIPTGIN